MRGKKAIDNTNQAHRESAGIAGSLDSPAARLEEPHRRAGRNVQAAFTTASVLIGTTEQDWVGKLSAVFQRRKLSEQAGFFGF
jgi:hypothetical protein